MPMKSPTHTKLNNSQNFKLRSSDILQDQPNYKHQNDVPWSSWRSGCVESAAPQHAGSLHQFLCGSEETIPYCD